MLHFSELRSTKPAGPLKKVKIVLTYLLAYLGMYIQSIVRSPSSILLIVTKIDLLLELQIVSLATT